MKKIFNLFILVFVCFLPVMVSAKSNLELKFLVEDNMFLYKEDGLYYFSDTEGFIPNVNYKIVFDEDGEYLMDTTFYDNVDTNSPYYFSSNKGYRKLGDYFGYWENIDHYYNEEYNYFFDISYHNEMFKYYDEDNNDIEVSFSDNISITKKYLGIRYDIYNEFKDELNNITKIEEYDNVYIVYYEEDYYDYALVLDKELNEIMTYENKKGWPVTGYEKDGIIYFSYYSDRIDTFRLDGTEIESIYVNNEWFEKEKYGYCGTFYVFDMEIIDNELILSYAMEWCESRYSIDDSNDIVRDDIGFPTLFSVIYSLEYEIDTVTSSDGEFTYETKVDENGESYVELKITPKDGYSVEEIIVTDANGERIEVTNNKFYRPLNDVKIEVKYVKGEYLPIPDTFLGKSVSLIIIGLVLVSLGFYTINYVRQE